MAGFDPQRDVVDAALVLDDGRWPNFHDAEVINLRIWRGDVRPQDDVWIGPQVEVEFELCALRHPYIVVLRFCDCDTITLREFDRQGALYDLLFSVEERGVCTDGTPLTPYICVTFRQAIGQELSFRCLRVQALERRDPQVGA